MRIVTTLLLLCSACELNCQVHVPAAPPLQVQRPPQSDLRVIPICVVNDADAPAAEDVITAALAALSESYRAEVGIALERHTSVRAAFKPNGWPMETAFALRKICPEEDELRFVFTDREVHRAEVTMSKAEDDAQMAGDSHPYYGFVIAYSAQERWDAKGAGGEHALIGTLKHELGHVFGLDDSQDKTSFMYFSSNASLGQWTDEARKTVRAGKWRRWWPRA